jgi:hypothetical protein
MVSFMPIIIHFLSSTHMSDDVVGTRTQFCVFLYNNWSHLPPSSSHSCTQQYQVECLPILAPNVCHIYQHAVAILCFRSINVFFLARIDKVGSDQENVWAIGQDTLANPCVLKMFFNQLCTWRKNLGGGGQGAENIWPSEITSFILEYEWKCSFKEIRILVLSGLFAVMHDPIRLVSTFPAETLTLNLYWNEERRISSGFYSSHSSSLCRLLMFPHQFKIHYIKSQLNLQFREKSQ